MKKAASLAEYMERTGTTHAALAKKLGISRSYVTLMALGERQPSLALALRIQALTGVPASALVMGVAA
jgi:transcriptional regulator with XRE-family HTH domain